MTLGEKIALIRKSNGFSQEQFGDLLGISRQAVSKWETGQSKPDLDYIVKIANQFEMTTDELLREDVNEEGGHKLFDNLAARNLRFKAGVFLSCMGVIFLILLYHIRVEGIGFDFGDVYVYGFWAWLIYNKLALIGFLTTCVMIFGGLFLSIRQAFPKNK